MGLEALSAPTGECCPAPAFAPVEPVLTVPYPGLPCSGLATPVFSALLHSIFCPALLWLVVPSAMLPES